MEDDLHHTNECCPGCDRGGRMTIQAHYGEHGLLAFCDLDCQLQFHLGAGLMPEALLERVLALDKKRSKSRFFKRRSSSSSSSRGSSSFFRRSRSNSPGKSGGGGGGPGYVYRARSPLRRLVGGRGGLVKSPSRGGGSTDGSTSTSSGSRSRSPLRRLFARGGRSRGGSASSSSSTSPSSSRSPLRRLMRGGSKSSRDSSRSASSSRSRSRSPIRRLYNRARSASRGVRRRLSGGSRRRSRGQRPANVWLPGVRFGYGAWWARQRPFLLRFLPYADWYPPAGAWTPYYTLVDAQYLQAYEQSGVPPPPEAFVVASAGDPALPELPTFQALGIDTEALLRGDAAASQARDAVSAELARLRQQYAAEEAQGLRVVPDVDRAQFSWVKVLG